jgi:hypothetical protein
MMRLKTNGAYPMNLSPVYYSVQLAGKEMFLNEIIVFHCKQHYTSKRVILNVESYAIYSFNLMSLYGRKW